MARWFAPCPRGLEAVLAGELRGLGAGGIATAQGGAGFEGPLEAGYAANLHSRVASRVLLHLVDFDAADEHALYAQARRFDWPARFALERTLRVNVTARASPLKSLEFATLRVKDAICDRFRDDLGARPSIDRAAPDVRVHVFLDGTRASLYLDTSGEALFKRGWRRAKVEAPLRENLAAGILALAGWTPQTPLLDPMCGSGTFLMEAAAIAARRPPGLGRSFGFEKLHGHDAKLWQSLRARAEAGVRPPRDMLLHASDRHPAAVAAARENFEAAGFADWIALERAELLEREAPAPAGVMVANPPYGERIGEADALAAFYPQLGDALKRRFAGWNCFFFTSDRRMEKLLRLAPSRRTVLYNGAIECRLFEFRVVAGSMRRAKVS